MHDAFIEGANELVMYPLTALIGREDLRKGERLKRIVRNVLQKSFFVELKRRYKSISMFSLSRLI